MGEELLLQLACEGENRTFDRLTGGTEFTASIAIIEHFAKGGDVGEGDGESLSTETLAFRTHLGTNLLVTRWMEGEEGTPLPKMVQTNPLLCGKEQTEVRLSLVVTQGGVEHGGEGAVHTLTKVAGGFARGRSCPASPE